MQDITFQISLVNEEDWDISLVSPEYPHINGQVLPRGAKATAYINVIDGDLKPLVREIVSEGKRTGLLITLVSKDF